MVSGVGGGRAFVRFRQVVAKNVRRLRRHHGWTQKQLAERLQCHKQTVWAIENARQGISDRLMDDLARTFEVDFLELVRHEGGKDAEQPGASQQAGMPAPRSAKVYPPEREPDPGPGSPGAGSREEASRSGGLAATGPWPPPAPWAAVPGPSEALPWPITPQEMHSLIRRAAYEAVRELMREYRVRPPEGPQEDPPAVLHENSPDAQPDNSPDAPHDHPPDAPPDAAD